MSACSDAPPPTARLAPSPSGLWVALARLPSVRLGFVDMDIAG